MDIVPYISHGEKFLQEEMKQIKITLVNQQHQHLLTHQEVIGKLSNFEPSAQPKPQQQVADSNAEANKSGNAGIKDSNGVPAANVAAPVNRD